MPLQATDRRSLSRTLLLVNLCLFVLAAIILVTAIKRTLHQSALEHARHLAQTTLERNLAVHTYFNQNLKPKIFPFVSTEVDSGYFDPTWMSSTFAVREIDRIYRSASREGYIYKEAAIDARFPENEADPFEASFIRRLNDGGEASEWSGIRWLDNQPFFVLLQRGETMKESCLRCHSTPERAPAGMITLYGDQRSFNRRVGEIVSAVSIRIPLAAAFQASDSAITQATTGLIGLLLLVLLVKYVFVNRFVLYPVAVLRDQSQRITTDESLLGEKVGPFRFAEFNDLAGTFNDMSSRLFKSRAHLETLVEERTSELSRTQKHLQDELIELASTQNALRDSENRFRMVFEKAGAGMFIMSPEGRLLATNQEFGKFLGIPADSLVGKHLADITHPDDRGQTLMDLKAVTAEALLNQEHETRFLDGNGSIRWGQVTVVWLRKEAENPYGIGLLQDITQRKLAEITLEERRQKIEFLAFHDPLTGLPNRRLFEDRLAQSLAKARRRKEKLALLFLDLDRFKTINDTLGHHCGDQVLVHAATKLSESLREEDTLARLGGDEFTIILEETDNLQKVQAVTQRIQELLSEPMQLKGQLIHISASIGISLYPDNGLAAEDLIKTADVAMYRAKDLGRNRFAFYAAEMDARSREFLIMENHLRYAEKNKELEIHFQPQVELASGRIMGTEALMRWEHPELGKVSPMDFIPVAEETGLIVPLGAWGLRTACRQHRQLVNDGNLRMAFNISPRQFYDANLVDTITGALAETGLLPSQLELEITENILLKDVDAAVAIMNRLHARGVHFVIDDFGAGYSSLSYLKKLPIQKLKIDRTFIREITENSHDAAIVSAVIALAKELQITVVAEGIETPEQLRFLLEKGCEYGQGFLFHQPLPFERAQALFAT